MEKSLFRVMPQSTCPWPGDDALMIQYHDEEWGVPVTDDLKLFEFLVLESAQAGLSWKTILHKREGYRKLFTNFDPQKIAKFTEQTVEKLLQDPSIIRNRAKIEATIHNAKLFLEIQKEFGSFSKYMWSFVQNKQINGNAKPCKIFQQSLQKLKCSLKISSNAASSF